MGIAPRVMALPSPTTIETDNGIDFLLNQQQQHTWNFKLYSTSLSDLGLWWYEPHSLARDRD